MTTRSIRNLEAVLLLPATCFLLPLLAAGAAGAGFALIANLAEPSAPLRDRLLAAKLSAAIMLWVAAAIVGMVAAWAAVFEQTHSASASSRRRRVLQALCLMAGGVAALVWLVVMAKQERNGAAEWATWLALLAGPLGVSLRHSWRLVRRAAPAARAFEEGAR
jgi:hypothetical protein